MKKRQKIRISILFMILTGLFLSGCDQPFGTQEKHDFSEICYVGANYGGASYGTVYDMISADVVLCTDKKVYVYLPSSTGDSSVEKLVATLAITDEQYNNIVNAVDRNMLYKLDPKPDYDVCDGYFRYLYLYDTHGEVCDICGGYMPKNKKFNEMYDAFCQNIPCNEINDIRSAYIDQLRKMEEGE